MHAERFKIMKAYEPMALSVKKQFITEKDENNKDIIRLQASYSLANSNNIIYDHQQIDPDKLPFKSKNQLNKRIISLLKVEKQIASCEVLNMQAFPFDVPFTVLMLMNGIVNLATTLPAAPGHIGTFDGPGIEVLEAFGVSQAMATGYTLVLHAALWLPITIIGLFYLWQARLDVGRVQKEMAMSNE